MADQNQHSLRRLDAELFVLSVLVLYLELMLIRWIGTEIRIFAYLGNLVLVLCFFGVGLGLYLSRQPVLLNRVGVSLLLLATLIANPAHSPWLDLKVLTHLLGGFDDYDIWQVALRPQFALVLGGLALLGVLMLLLLFIFVPLGQLLGRAFADHPKPIRAYSFNIAGSLAGVWLFQTASVFSLPPPWWFAAGAVVAALLVIVRNRKEWMVVALTGVAAIAVAAGTDRAWRTVWSPYQKLALAPNSVQGVADGYELKVNDAGFQVMLNLSEPFLRAHPDVFDVEEARRSYYNLPFVFKPHIRHMLIIGAGTGNNAAAALRHGVEQVDCVEIDPQIYALGKELHPEQPYDSPRVRMVVNDARAFLKHATNRYDAIWFALLDAHTLGSSLHNLRLDHYVYTAESFEEAHQLLADDGLFFMNFDAPRRWLADRLFGMLRHEFGHAPLSFTESHSDKYGVGSGATLVTGNQPINLDIVADPSLREHLRASALELTGNQRPTSDDWPYLYLQHARIPRLHALTSLTILGVVAIARRRVLGWQGWLDRHFFGLGAAFLLLEVQTVSRATLLFGMTWVVNAIVISAVLVMILLANLLAARRPNIPQSLPVAGLVVTLAALALIPLGWFNVLSPVWKLVAASAFLTAPIFFSGLIFIRSFANCPDRAAALGSNLIGALVGGLLESVAFITGIRALVGLVGMFYLVALWPRSKK